MRAVDREDGLKWHDQKTSNTAAASDEYLLGAWARRVFGMYFAQRRIYRMSLELKGKAPALIDLGACTSRHA